MINIETTAVIEAQRHSFLNIREAKQWTKENLVGEYYNAATSEFIIVSKSALDKCLSESAIKKSASYDAHISAILVLPELIKSSILGEVKLDRNLDRSIEEIRRFYSAVRFDGVVYPVKITVKVVRNEGNRFYCYEVIKIESPVSVRIPDHQS